MIQTRLALLACLAALSSAVPAWQADDSLPRHLLEAEKLVDAIQPSETEYRHRPSVAKWPGEDGGPECRTDCSGFVDLLLQHSYPWATKTWLADQTGKKRPLAADLYEAVLAHHGFSTVANESDIRPGDFIVIKYPPDSDNSGHIMLIEKAPREHRATEPMERGTTQWDVGVIDETSSYHGTADSRYAGKGIKAGGVGRGTLRIYTNADGTFAGYTWSNSKASKFYGPDERPMVVARLDSPR